MKNELAFPDGESQNWGHTGLTKRELFAGMALQGYLAMYGGSQAIPKRTTAAQYAVEFADALLEALNEPTHQVTGEKS